MPDIVFSDRTFGGLRQIKLQLANLSDPYAMAQWIVAIKDQSGTQSVRFLDSIDRPSDYTYHVKRFGFDPLKLDLAPHHAFVFGDMPPEIYADWLEENGIDLPTEAFSILRWRVDHPS